MVLAAIATLVVVVVVVVVVANSAVYYPNWMFASVCVYTVCNSPLVVTGCVCVYLWPLVAFEANAGVCVC